MIKTKMMIREFTDIGNVAGLWIAQGREMLVSANFLSQNSWFNMPFEKKSKVFEEDIWKYKHHNTSLMLKAMALECYLKGALISKGKKLFKDGKLDSSFNKHCLIDFYDMLNLQRNENEKRILKYLEHWIYSGRYPISNKYNSIDGLPKHPNDKTPGRVIGLSWASPNDNQTFNGIIEKVMELINSE
jgi:hypothetical protein